MTEEKFNKAQPKMRGMTRAVALWSLGGLGALAVIYIGLWFFLSHQLYSSVQGWIEQQRKSGMQVRYTDSRRGGFPFAVTAIFDQPMIISDRQPVSFAWHGPQAAVSLKPWQPWHVHIALGGAQQIAITKQGKTVTWQGQAETLSADVRLGFSSRTHLTMNFAKIDMRTTTGGVKKSKALQQLQLEQGRIGINRFRQKNMTEKTPSLIVSADITGLHVPKSLPLILGHDFSKIALEAQVLGSLPRSLEACPLLAWRDAGGTIEIERAEIIHGPLNLKANGTVALDSNLQPVGAFSTQIQGFFDIITVLRDRGMIKPRVALTARFVLGALSKRPPEGGRPRLDVALSIQNQKVFVGPLAIMKLPSIRWETVLRKTAPKPSEGTP